MNLLQQIMKTLEYDYPGEPKRGQRVPILMELSDEELDTLLEMVCDEGLARGRGRWWWE